MGTVSTVLAKGMRRVGHLPLAGGGQVQLRDGYAYVGHMDAPDGTSIIDIAKLATQMT